MRKTGETDDRNMVGIVNCGRSARFILLVDHHSMTYDISTIRLNQLSFTFMPKSRRKVQVSYELYDSMDDLHEGISRLAKGFKENKSDHIHCWKGGKEHTHQVNDLGLKVGKCPARKSSEK